MVDDRLGVVTAGPVDHRSVGGDVALPFACRDGAGGGDPTVVIKARAIQCALSRICGVCGLPLGRPVAFVGTPEETASEVFAFPPLHDGCARQLASARSSRLLTTSAFDLLRPSRRGDPVAFRATAVLDGSADWS